MTKLSEKTKVPAWPDSPEADKAAAKRAEMVIAEQTLRDDLAAIEQRIKDKTVEVGMRRLDPTADKLATDMLSDEIDELEKQARDMRRQLAVTQQVRAKTEALIGEALTDVMAIEARKLKVEYIIALQGAMDALWQASKWFNRAALLYAQAQADFGLDMDESKPRYQPNAGLEPFVWADVRSNLFRRVLTFKPTWSRQLTRLETWMQQLAAWHGSIKLPDDFNPNQKTPDL